MNEQRCPVCDERVLSDARFCMFCGALMKDVLLGKRYQLKEQLGAGGMGVVFRVKDTWSGGHFALKWLQRKIEHDAPTWNRLRQRFRREIRLLSRCESPFVVSIVDAGEDSGCLYYVMELLKGHSLRHYMQQKQPTRNEILLLSKDICRGLEVLHQQGIVHRDITLDNIWVRENGRVVLLDLGVAFDLFDEGRLTKTNILPGSPHFMAPERIRQKSNDVSIDQYGLGVVLFEMVTGQLPFEGDARQVLAAHLLEEAPSILFHLLQGKRDKGWRKLADVIARLLKKEPLERFESVRKVRSALLRVPMERPTLGVERAA